jgi:hypothetical protein
MGGHPAEAADFPAIFEDLVVGEYGRYKEGEWHRL